MKITGKLGFTEDCGFEHINDYSLYDICVRILFNKEKYNFKEQEELDNTEWEVIIGDGQAIIKPII